MRVAVLGAGRIGKVHARLLAEHPDVDEVRVGDTDPERAVTPEEALASDPDAAVIAAPTHMHAELIVRCLDAGLPTFCEKPIALDLEQTRAVVERAERGDGAILQVGFQRRFDAGHVAARRLLESGGLGTLLSVRIASHDPEPPHEEYIAHSGGIFRDLHIHDFDALRWLTGREAREVYAAGSVRVDDVFERYGDFDTTAVQLVMEDGVLAAVTGARRDPLGYDVRAELFGTEDSVAVGLGRATPLRSLEPGAEGLIPGPHHDHFSTRFADAYRAELAHFLDLARGRAENPCTARDAFEALRISVAADRSIAEHRPVALAEVEW